jgi:hypothetical protein
MRLVSVVLLTLQQPDDSGMLEALGHVVGTASERLAFVGARDDLVCDRFDVLEYRV